MRIERNENHHSYHCWLTPNECKTPHRFDYAEDLEHVPTFLCTYSGTRVAT